MKKGHIFLIVVAAVVGIVIVVCSSPLLLLFGGAVWDATIGNFAQIEIDSYRLCEDQDGEEIIIIKYLLKNEGKEPTSLIWEGEFYVYQNGVGLNEYIDELPKECHYDPEDQYKNVKGGVEYYAEIAYRLEDPEGDVEVEVVDYGLIDNKKEKVFTIVK